MEDRRVAIGNDRQAGFWRRHRWLMWLIGILVAGLAVLVGAILVVAHRAEPMLRARIVAALSEHFHAHVELDSFHLKLREGLWAEGGGLRIWPAAQAGDAAAFSLQARPDGKPLIQLTEFRFHTPLSYDPSKPIHISVIELKGLEIDVPPHSHFAHGLASVSPLETAKAHTANMLFHFEVGSLECSGAHLTIEPGKPGKEPLVFDIAHLEANGFSPDQAMRFQAKLTNPRPRGTIYTQGTFGPWQVADPGESSVQGDYKFENADLGTFRGIAGIMNSTGHYEGTLRNMDVNGETDSQDFRLTHYGTALPLHTRFHALVDGTNGDTQLKQVEATLARSHFWLQGQIVRALPNEAHKGGHDIVLNVNVDSGRMEDFLRLASKSGSPLLTGALTMKAALNIPPGAVPVHERLKLQGSFVLDQAQFTSPKIQDRITELSARGQGQPKQAKTSGDAPVRSAMKGNFRMADGVVTLPALEYIVPGAVIDLKGTYGVEGGRLDFVGAARMQATVSQMVGGWKGLLLKPLDRYFQKDGAGTMIPVHIDGTREDPHFGVDLGRLKTTSPQRPDEQP